MRTITFDQSGNAINIQGWVSYDSGFWDSKKSQFEKRNLNGDPIVYSTGNTIVRGLLILKNVSYTDGQSLKSWLKTYAQYMINSFTLATDSNEVNLGLGLGAIVKNVNYTKNSDKDLLKYMKPGIYLVKFPYRFIRT